MVGDFFPTKPKEESSSGGTSETIIRPTERTFEQKIEVVKVEVPGQTIIERERIIERPEKKPRAQRKPREPKPPEPPKPPDVSVEERFEDLKIMVRLVANGVRPALFISGQSGASKTHTVMYVLEQELKLKEGVDFFHARGNTTPKGIYKTFHDWNNRLLVFDDSDSAFGDVVSKNLIKGALDTTPSRRIVWISNDTFDPRTVTDEERGKLLEKGKLPLQIDFTGRVIFISNLKFDDVDEAIKTRCLTVNIEMTKEEFIQMMRLSLPNIRPDIELSVKEEILDFLATNYKNESKELTFRTIVTAIELKSSGVEEWFRILSRYG